MSCPRCHAPLSPGICTCPACGMPVFQIIPDKPKPLRTGILAFLRALCYFLLFYGVQLGVILIYEFVLAFALMYQRTKDALLTGDYETDPGELIEQIYAYITENIHILLILSATITVLFLAVFFRIRRKDALAEMHIRPIAKGTVLPCLLFGAALQIVTLFTVALLPIPESTLESLGENAQLITGGPLWLEIVSIVLITPILEELIFRGLIFSRLRRGMALWIALPLSAVIFGWAHGHIISFLYAGILGVFLALLMQRQNDSILCPILTHLGFNGTSYLLEFLPAEIPDTLFFSLYFVSIALSVICAYILLRKKEDTADLSTNRKEI